MGIEAAKNEACWNGIFKLDFTCARSAMMPGRSQNGCFDGRMAGTYADAQSDRYNCSETLSEQVHPVRISTWREGVLAAEARKAGSASEDTCLTPRPPSLTGRLACSHCISERSELVMPWTADLSSESKWAWAERETDGEQCRRCRTFGVLNDVLSISASWEPSSHNLLTALKRSSQRSNQAWPSTGPENSGAPMRVASFGLTLWNDYNCLFLTEKPWCAISSHLSEFRNNPMSPIIYILLLSLWFH